MYLYETHSHTSPVSRCAKSTVRQMLEMYKGLGYTGVFITNHFLALTPEEHKTMSYEEKIRYFFSDFEEGVSIGQQIGIDVFSGAEISHGGTDFLIYGLDKEWYLAHPELEVMKMSDKLRLLAEEGALVIQAHPFRQARYIDHIRLYPDLIHGAEIHNACRTDFENEMAKHYASSYKLLPFAGTDAHAHTREDFAGLAFDEPIADERDFAERVRQGKYELFSKKI